MPKFDFKWQYLAEIVKVVDGDTVVVNIDFGAEIIKKNETVRLMGIDTPEIRGSSTDAEKQRQKVLGFKAKEYVQSLMKPGDIVIMKSEQYLPEGKFGRILADFSICFDGAWINSLTYHLLETGYAKVYRDGETTTDRFRGILLEEYPKVDNE